MTRFKHLPRVYGALLRSGLGLAMAYRGLLVIWILSGMLPLIMLFVWLTIAQDQPDGQINGFNSLDFISYYLAVVVLRRMTGVWIIWDIDEDIRLGRLSTKLLRPLDPAHNYLTMAVSDKPVELAFIAPPIAIAAWLLGATYDLAPANVLLVLAAAAGAIGIEFGVSMLVGALGFWMTQTISVMEVWFYSRAFFSGWIIPLAMFPEVLQEILVYLPYRYVLSFPLELLLGGLASGDIFLGFAIQWCWVLALLAAHRFIWARGLRHYSAVGA